MFFDNFLIFVITTSLFLGALFFYFIYKSFRRWRLRSRLRRGISAEKKAERLLQSRGYEVLSVQRPFKMSMYVDGYKKEYTVRPDAFARKRRMIYVVEFKTGSTAPNPVYKNTRRQLLEYYHGISADGLLLVNVDDGSIRNIKFGDLHFQKRCSWGLVIVSFLAGAILASVATGIKW